MLKTYPEQIAASLREGLREGRWTGTMPGCDRLAREFNVSSRTVVRALALLEQEGLLESQGVGRGDGGDGVSVHLLTKLTEKKETRHIVIDLRDEV